MLVSRFDHFTGIIDVNFRRGLSEVKWKLLSNFFVNLNLFQIKFKKKSGPQKLRQGFWCRNNACYIHLCLALLGFAILSDDFSSLSASSTRSDYAPFFKGDYRALEFSAPAKMLDSSLKCDKDIEECPPPGDSVGLDNYETSGNPSSLLGRAFASLAPGGSGPLRYEGMRRRGLTPSFTETPIKWLDTGLDQV